VTDNIITDSICNYDYVNIYNDMICWLWSLYCNFVCSSKQ